MNHIGKIITLGLLGSFLLSGCGASTPSMSIDETKSYLATFSAVTHAKYTYVSEGHFLGMDDKAGASWAYSDGTIATGKHLGSGASSSHYFQVPLHLTADNFYVANEAGNGPDLTDCIYGLIKSKTYVTGSTMKISLEKTEEGGLLFAIRNVDTKLTFHGALDDDVEATARYNYLITYGADGYLKQEYAASINYQGEDSKTTIRAFSDYTYE